MRHRTHLFALLILCFWSVLACKKDDNSTPEKPIFSVNNISQREGDGTNEVLLYCALSATSTEEVRLKYATQNGTAIADLDYVAQSGDLVFAPGEKSKPLRINLKGDSDFEQAEDFSVVFTGAANVQLTQASVKITILNDDVSIPANGYTTPLTYPGKTLVWQNEFEGNELNLSEWTHETGNGIGGWGNHELQFYQASNTAVSGGNLIIKAINETVSSYNYTSSRIITKGKKEFVYGRIDIRAALPKGAGMWPALWMLGSDINQVSWPACGEIDIMEMVGKEPDKVVGTVHYGSNTSSHQYVSKSISSASGTIFADAFHVFSIVWEKDRIRWYVDDVLYHDVTAASIGSGYAFNHPFFFIFNLAVGGDWPGPPNNTTVFPQALVVDYVRVFQ